MLSTTFTQVSISTEIIEGKTNKYKIVIEYLMSNHWMTKWNVLNLMNEFQFMMYFISIYSPLIFKMTVSFATSSTKMIKKWNRK